ncbi:MAG: hypothetical protein HFG12_03685 [Oscillibacter sp.]|nr:hypothetical protein [uncultured Oscillibacter sp.]MCI8812329.1 hypothetical protein [Oscillibacter sp.]
MKIEKASQLCQAYRKSTDQSASKPFQQMMQARSQDRYVPSTNTQLFNPEANFISADIAGEHLSRGISP